MDLSTAQQQLAKLSLWQNFVENYWDDLSNYLIIEDINAEVLFVEHGAINRKVYVILDGLVEAYAIGQGTKMIESLCDFKPSQVCGEVTAIFGNRWSYGLRSLIPSKLLVIDLELIEHTAYETDMYVELFNLLYFEIGNLTAKINNFRIKKNINLHDLFVNQPLFFNFSTEDFDNVKNYLKYDFILTNKILINNNETLERLYFLQTGIVGSYNLKNNLIATDVNRKYEPGSLIGAEEFIENVPAVGITKTITPSFVLDINIEPIKQAKNACSLKLMQNLASYFSVEANQLVAHSKDLCQKITAIKKDRVFSNISLKLLFIFAIISLCLEFKAYYFPKLIAYNFYINKFLIIIGLAAVVLSIKSTRLQLSYFGLTRKNLQKSLGPAILFGLILSAIIFFWNELVLFYFYKSGEYIFPDFVLKYKFFHGKYIINILILILYTGLYELVIRACLQTSLSYVFSGSFWVRNSKAIIAANIFAGLFFANIFYDFSLSLLICGLFWGWLFARYKNIYSVIISHVIYQIIILTQVGILVF